MTTTLSDARAATTTEAADRFRLNRAGILNVWQYDDQEFLLADGRMLLRGANGAGKSKTMEMLLPFAIDGDKARITASARHHTSLLWLMTDGYDGQARVGYVWVEFLRPGADGRPEAFTCGVGIRASASARTATAWYFATRRRVGHDLHLEDDGGPLSRPRLEDALGDDGQVFQQAAAYKEHVGRALFGLDPTQYDEVLRLLYWLRQPQIGEDIEPARLAGQLALALPQLDEHAVRAAGETFDELTAFGEQIERRSAAAEALTALASAYAGYARATAATRGRAVLEVDREERRLRTAVRRRERDVHDLRTRRDDTDTRLMGARQEGEADRGRINELEAGPEARDQRRLGELAELAAQHDRAATHAEERVARSRAGHVRRGAEHQIVTEDVLDRIRSHGQTLRALDQRQRESGLGAPVDTPAALEIDRLDDPDRSDTVAVLLGRSADALAEAGSAVLRRQATMSVVVEALDLLELVLARQADAERRAEETDGRWERARDHREAAQSRADELASELGSALHDWSGMEAAPEVALPVELTPETVVALPELARLAAAPELEVLRDFRQAAATTRDNAEAGLDALARDRDTIEAERDPAPPPPGLPRTPRPDGRALWQLVDFTDDLPQEARAGLEAALQASGLLDAWVRSDGRLLDAHTLDVILAAQQRPPGSSTAADVLRADVPEGAGLAVADVERILSSIRLGSPDHDLDDDAHGAGVDTDGRWRLGPLHGRAAKECAQYVGVTARAQERHRRLAEIDAAADRARAVRSEAIATVAGRDADIAAVEEWVRAVPSAAALLGAWTRADERREAEDREERANAAAQAEAHRVRGEVVRARNDAEQLSVRHDVPLDRGQLAALAERLHTLDRDLGRAADGVRPLRRDLARWAADHRALVAEAQALVEEAGEAESARANAAVTRSRWQELRSAVGSSVRQLEERLAQLRVSVAGHLETATEAETTLRALSEKLGEAKQAASQAHQALTAHGAQRTQVVADLVALTTVPGLLDAAAAAAGIDPAPLAMLTGVADLPADEQLPPGVLTLAEQLAGLAPPDEAADPSTVWRGYNDASSGPGADHEPAVATYADLLAVTGRDEAGEQPIASLASRVSAAVAKDRELLTERERERFEQHVLGELGEAIRRCRVEADELVTAMNQLLAGVSTSQGIRVRLDWRLRDDVPPEAREAVALLSQPLGALVPEERAGLRDALHRLIEASRAERPELSYGEHLAVALDYRSWFAFKIRYTRPESAGSWSELHRRSPLSQGEQKVLCYLPLFAAAAAHFSSLAGAAAYAPRLVLLDDAFPKIDTRTHPLLFGLLVDLDLDFVITSERLWGDHDTVPSLAIYEALRDPAQRGIAQFEYRWDGRQLRSLG